MSQIGYLNYYIDNSLSINDYFEQCTLNLSSIEKERVINNIGVKYISIINDDFYDIVEKMISNYLEQENIDKSTVKYIIFAGDGNACENLAFLVQSHFNFPDTSILNLKQSCSSTLYAIGMLGSMLKRDERGLIISTCYKEEMNRRFIGYTVIGDGIGIMEIKNENASSLEIAGFKYISKIEHVTEDRIKIVKSGVSLIKSLMKQSGLVNTSLDYFIPQNINKVGYEKLYSKLLSISPQRMFLNNISRTGHLGDVDTIVNLKDCISMYHPDTMLLYGLGGDGDNYNFNGVVLKESSMCNGNE